MDCFSSLGAAFLSDNGDGAHRIADRPMMLAAATILTANKGNQCRLNHQIFGGLKK
jgi:hypothetical protein